MRETEESRDLAAVGSRRRSRGINPAIARISPRGRAVIIGVTGGIGAGKSTVCAAFEEAGARVIDADATGHEVLRDPIVIRNLTDVFGREILDSHGQNRTPGIGQTGICI